MTRPLRGQSPWWWLPLLVVAAASIGRWPGPSGVVADDMSAHVCHALGCSTAVPPRMFMCYRHWSLIPKAKQRELWRVYREGQEIDKAPTREYLAVARSLRVYVADAEGVPVPPLMREMAE